MTSPIDTQQRGGGSTITHKAARGLYRHDHLVLCSMALRLNSQHNEEVVERNPWKRLAGALLVLLSSVSCAQVTEMGADSKPTPTEFIGYWKTEARATQLGRGFDSLCLKPDGTYFSSFHSQGADLNDRGTYSIKGGMIRFDGLEGVYEEKITLRDDDLVAGSVDGEPLHYKKVSDSCPRRL